MNIENNSKFNILIAFLFLTGFLMYKFTDFNSVADTITISAILLFACVNLYNLKDKKKKL